jgi:hypothetical protein
VDVKLFGPDHKYVFPPDEFNIRVPPAHAPVALAVDIGNELIVTFVFAVIEHEFAPVKVSE